MMSNDVALVLEHAVEADVTLAFAWKFRIDVANWNDPPARFEIDGPFLDGTRGRTFLPGQQPLTWWVRGVVPERSFVIEMRLEDAVLHSEWHFDRVAEHATRLTQRIVLAGRNAAAYVEQVRAGFGANLAAGMAKIAREMIAAERAA